MKYPRLIASRASKHVFTAAIVLMLLLMTVSASAATVNIPASVTTIEAGAFEDDTSLDTVILPNGIVTIGSRAFAGSSITTINLPMSLESIAADAFQDTSVTAVVYDGSYAASYVQDNNVDYVLLDADDYNVEIVEEGIEWHISTDGLDVDTGDEEINTALQNLRVTIEQCNEVYDRIVEFLDEVEVDFDELSYFANAVDYQYQVASEVTELLAKGYEVTSFSSSDDDIIQIEIEVDGERYTLIQTSDGMTLASSVQSVSTQSVSTSAVNGVVSAEYSSTEVVITPAMLADSSRWQKVKDQAVKISEFVSQYDSVYEQANQYLAHLRLLVLEKEGAKEVAKLAGKLDKLGAWFEFAGKALGILELPAKCKAVTDADAMIKELEEIRSHGHPCGQELLFDYSVEISATLNTKISGAIWGLRSEMLNGLFGSYQSLAALKPKPKTTGGGSGWWNMSLGEDRVGDIRQNFFDSSVNNGTSGLFDFAFNKAHALYSEAIAYEHELHYLANVVVKDANGNQVGGAKVVCVGVEFETDGSGLCSIEVPYSQVALEVSKEGYKTTTVGSSCQPYIPQTLPVTLEKLCVTGRVTDSKTDEPLADVRISNGIDVVYSNGEGYYEFDLPEGDYNLTFSKSDYKDWNTGVSVHGQVKQDAPLDYLYGKASGIVKDASGNPMSNVRIVISGGGIVKTGSDGFYEITFPVGSYSLKFQHRVTRTKNESFTISPHDDIKRDIILIRPVLNGSINGRVFAWSEYDTCAGCRVTTGTTSVFTDDDGFFSIDLPDGEQTLYYEYDYYYYEDTYEVRNSDKQYVEVEMFMGWGDV